MIYVDGVPFSSNDSSSSSQGSDILSDLLKHSFLVSASHSFNTMLERKLSVSQNSGSEISAERKWVYLFQREYATVDPALVELVGTDEATTCVGLVIRNSQSGMTSVAHLDSPEIVDIGVDQMLSLVIDQNADAVLDVHLVGGFDDALSEQANGITKNSSKGDGYSLPVCAKIIETLEKSSKKFQIQILHVLGHNTRRDSKGNAYPIFHGFLVEMSSGSVIPASFDRSTRCPDEIVRRIRVTASFEDTNWKGRLLDTYDTQTDQFVIAPCTWSIRQLHIALTLQNLSDAEILLSCSTSPSAEAPDFVDNLRRQWEYLIQHPNWRETFPLKQPRVFERTADGNWTMKRQAKSKVGLQIFD